MRIVEIRERTAPLGTVMRNASIDFSKMTISLVAVVTDVVRDGAPVVGYGFNSNGRYAQGGILRERLIPRIMAAEPASLLDDDGANLDPRRIRAAMMANEKPGGHGDRAVAAAAIDVAVWDAVAKIAGQPLWRVVADLHNGGAFDERVMVYPGGGYYYPDRDIESLQAEMRGYLDQGYRIAKMKIGGAPMAADMKRIEAAISVVGAGNLAVDSNGAFDRGTAFAYAEAMAPYGLFWWEEPVDPLDYALHGELAGRYAPAIATGENLFSVQDVRNLLRHAGLRPDRDWIQPDPALCHGPTEFLDMVALCDSLGWPRRRIVPHGGHQVGLNLAAGLQLGGCESYPLVFRPFGGFADDIPVEDGTVALPGAPGIGMELKPALHAELRRMFD